MKPLTLEWIEKAEADFASAIREFRARTRPNYDDTCFHSQQCIEKYLKARLQEADIPFEKTHNLMALLDGVLKVEPLWEQLRPRLSELSVFSSSFRYPGESSDKETARRALSICRKLRQAMRAALRVKGSEH
jgi:HEPN domain-containing protein